MVCQPGEELQVAARGRLLVDLDVSAGADPGRCRAVLEAALTGAGPAVRPVLGHADASTTLGGPGSSEVPDGVAAVVCTSGSTGVAKQVLLGGSALRAAATATHEALGGPGQWVLAMPADRIGGLLVLIRSILAGTEPVPVAGPAFRAEEFVAAARVLGEGARYTALVPTQLIRLLEDPAATSAMASLDAVLVGGATLTPAVRERAERARVPVVATYGTTETCGGCVYDGRPLPGVAVEVVDGRVLLGGPTVALGYRDDPAHTQERFSTDGSGTRWFRTDDAGAWHDGSLKVSGRLDDTIVSGGVNVVPSEVEAALAGLEAVAAAVVVGVPDAQWGQLVAAALVASPGSESPPDLGAIRDTVRARLPAAWLPRQVRWVPQLPVLPSGKPDRAAVAALLSSGDGTMGDHR